jgi:lactate permease
MNILTILSCLPFLGIIYFLLFRGVHARFVMMGVYIFTLLLLAIFWHIKILDLLLISVFGVANAIDIFLIIGSIVLLFSLFQKTGRIQALENFLRDSSLHPTVMLFVLGWFLVHFFEGIAGFGTPIVIVAPLLLLCGYRPITAVIVPLISNSISVVFGAFGTPILMGIGKSIPDADLQTITVLAASINSILGIFTPILLLFFVRLLEKKKKEEFPLLKYSLLALSAGICFAVPFWITAVYLGPELPSVIGSLAGLAIFLLLLHFGVFGKGISFSTSAHAKMVMKSFLPYLAIILLFVFSRIDFFSFGTLLKILGFSFSWQTLTHSFSLYSPGFLIFFVFLATALLSSLSRHQWKDIVLESFEKTKFALVTLLFTLAFVKILIYSDLGDEESIPHLLGEALSILGQAYQFFAPFLGAFGAFIAGSATVSNLIFASIQESAAKTNDLVPSLILALQALGSSFGNMIAIHNVVAASSVVGLSGKESLVIRNTLPIVFLFCLFSGVVGGGIIMFLR